MPNNYKKQILFFHLILITVLFSSLKTFAQADTVYVDEDNQNITKTLYLKKSKSGLYRGQRFSTDTIVLAKLRLRYCFGKLEPHVKEQLFKLLYTRNHIDTIKTLLIHYGDTLRNPSYYAKNNKERKYMYSFVHEHYNTYEGFIFAHKQCEKRKRKFKKHTQVLHFYNVNDGHPEQYKKLVWYKDYGSILSKLFLSGYLRSDEIIIRPNGEFYIGYNSYFLTQDLLQKGKWEKYKNEFENKLDILNQYKK